MSSCSMLVLLKPQRSMSSSRDPLSHMLGTAKATSLCTRIGSIFLIMLGKLHSEGWEWHASSMSLASNVWTLILFLRFDPDLFQQWWILTYFWQQKKTSIYYLPLSFFLSRHLPSAIFHSRASLTLYPSQLDNKLQFFLRYFLPLGRSQYSNARNNARCHMSRVSECRNAHGFHHLSCNEPVPVQKASLCELTIHSMHRYPPKVGSPTCWGDTSI